MCLNVHLKTEKNDVVLIPRYGLDHPNPEIAFGLVGQHILSGTLYAATVSLPENYEYWKWKRSLIDKNNEEQYGTYLMAHYMHPL